MPEVDERIIRTNVLNLKHSDNVSLAACIAVSIVNQLSAYYNVTGAL